MLEVELTSVGDARPILDAVYGRQADDWRRVDIERHLEVASGQRGSRKRIPSHVVMRALVVHYLWESGGGRRSFDAAWDLYVQWFGDRDPSSARGWDYGRQRETVERLEQEFGPLARRAA